MNHTWYLFRHALATQSTTGYGDQILTANILPEGITPVKKIAEFLNNIGPSANYTSEIIRCRQTVEIVIEITQKIFIPDKRLNEYHEEQFDHLSKRISNFIKEVNEHNQSNIVICTHGSVIAGLRYFLTQGTFKETDVYNYPSCGELVIIENNIISVKDFNDERM